jgi:hypothetical protein
LESEIESLILRGKQRLLDQSVIAFSTFVYLPQSVLVTQAKGGAEYHLNG